MMGTDGKVDVMDLRDTSILDEITLRGVDGRKDLFVQTFMEHDEVPHGKQVNILDDRNASVFFQRVKEMNPFGTVTHFLLHHSLPESHLISFQITTKEGKSTIHLVFKTGTYYTQEICH